MHSQQPPGVVQNWSTLQCSKQNTEQCGYDHAPVTRGRMRAQFPLPHGPGSFPLDGLRGSAFRWRTAGWVGQSGPVCNVDLWIRALDLVDRVSATVKWLRVPSHTDIPGNERAHVLAEEGRVSSPLYHVLSLPDRPVVSLELPSTPTPRRAPAVPRSLELHDVITPSGHRGCVQPTTLSRLSRSFPLHKSEAFLGVLWVIHNVGIMQACS